MGKVKKQAPSKHYRTPSPSSPPPPSPKLSLGPFKKHDADTCFDCLSYSIKIPTADRKKLVTKVQLFQLSKPRCILQAFRRKVSFLSSIKKVFPSIHPSLKQLDIFTLLYVNFMMYTCQKYSSWQHCFCAFFPCYVMVGSSFNNAAAGVKKNCNTYRSCYFKNNSKCHKSCPFAQPYTETNVTLFPVA